MTTSNDPPPLGFDPNNLPNDFGGADFSSITPEQAVLAFQHLSEEEVAKVVADLEAARAAASDERKYIERVLEIVANIGKIAIKFLT